MKGNIHLSLEIKLTSESNCFVCASMCAYGIYILQTYSDYSLGIIKAGLLFCKKKQIGKVFSLFDLTRVTLKFRANNYFLYLG